MFTNKSAAIRVPLERLFQAYFPSLLPKKTQLFSILILFTKLEGTNNITPCI